MRRAHAVGDGVAQFVCTAHDYDGGEWRQLEALQIPTSWNDFHPIYVHLRE